MASTSASRTRAPSLRTRVLILLKASSYGVQVRRVGGQEHKLCSPRFDELPYPPWSVRPHPVEHHHLPLTKRGRQEEVLHVGPSKASESVAPSAAVMEAPM